MTNGQNVARSRHLEELANAAKRYTLREILDVTNAVATELENISIGGGGSSSTGIILPTVANSVDGGFWLDVSGDTPVPKFFYGGNVYTLGGTSSSSGSETPSTPDYSEYLIAYLPFDTSATEDTCGNTWTAYGSPTIQNGVLSLNGSSWLTFDGIEELLGNSTYTIDF